MTKETISFRADSKKIKELDKIVKSYDSDRTTIINNAINSLIAFEQYQINKIKKAIESVERGEFVTEEEAQRVFNKYKPKPHNS